MAVTVYDKNGAAIDLDIQQSQSTPNNTSTVTVSAYLRKSGEQISYNYNGVPFALSIAGDKKTVNWTFDLGAMSVGERRLIVSHSLTIYHNPDGSHDPVAVLVFSDGQTAYVGAISGKTTVTLPTIPRASTISVSNVILPGAIPVTIQRKHSGFRMKLVLETADHQPANAYGIAEWEVAAQSAIPKTLSLSDAQVERIYTITTKAASRALRLCCYTYSGSNYIGSSQAILTASFPASVNPTATMQVSVDGKTLNGLYLQNHNRVRCALSASPKYGATIESIVFTYEGLGYKPLKGTSALRLFPLNKTGQQPIKAVVTDSRGRSVTLTQTITVTPYAPPKLMDVQLERADKNGAPKDNGEYVFVRAKYQITALSGNAKTLSAAKGSQMLGSTTLPNYQGAYSGVLGTSVALDVNQTHEITLRLSDSINTLPVTVSLSTGFTLINFHASGTSFAIGGVSTDPNRIQFYTKIRADVYQPTYLNGWRAHGTSYQDTCYWVDCEGFLNLYLLANSSSATKEHAFTLPETMRPKSIVPFVASTGVCHVYPTGAVMLFRNASNFVCAFVRIPLGA